MVDGPGGPQDVRMVKKAVAARLGIDESTLARWVRAGKFPPSHWMAERHCWWLSEVVAWEQANQGKPERSRNRNLIPNAPKGASSAA